MDGSDFDAGVERMKRLVSESSPPRRFSVQPRHARTVFSGAMACGRAGASCFYLWHVCSAVQLRTGWAGSLNRGMSFGQMFEEFGVLVAAVIPALVWHELKGGRGEHTDCRCGRRLQSCFGWARFGDSGITLLLGILHGFRVFDFGHVVLHGIRLAKFASFWGGLFLVVGFCEEFLFRGLLAIHVDAGVGFWPAAVLLSCAFGASHLKNAGEGWAGVLAAGLIGLFLCLTLRRTGSLWFAVGFHAAWDWGESFFYSVPDSGTISPGHLLSSSFHGSRWITGGSAGPEGSLLCFAVIAVLWAAFARVYPDVKYGAV